MATEQVVPYLTHPIALVGYALMLVFSIHRALIRAGILKKLSERSSSKVVQLILKYGFWLAGLTIVLGFALQGLGIIVPEQTKRKRLDAIGANTVRAYQSSFELFGATGTQGSGVFAATDTTFEPYVPINEAFTAPQRIAEPHTGRYSLNFAPEGNPIVRPTKVAYATGVTVAVSAAVLNVVFDVSASEKLQVAFFAKSSSNPRPATIHNCDSSLALYVKRDDDPWSHFISQCGSHKSENSGWRELRYEIPTNDAATMQIGFVYQLQNNTVADPEARFLIDDLDVRVWPPQSSNT